MNLSQYENEDAIDLLADMLDPLSEIASDEVFRKKWESGEPVVRALAYALRTHKEAIIQMIAAMHREDPKKFRFTMATLMADMLELVQDPLFQTFFPMQSPVTGAVASGSVTENTEGANE